VGSEATEVGRGWTGASLIATESFLDRHPRTVRALLRTFVRGIRLVRSDRELSVQTIMNRLKYECRDAERAYESARAAFDERGGFSSTGVRAFWEMAVAAGDVEAPWPESRFVDRRWLDRFDSWAPEP
jgi:ABC-type nitrate/sulfonate/bicarbonate transport system substrate-binding protein